MSKTLITRCALLGGFVALTMVATTSAATLALRGSGDGVLDADLTSRLSADYSRGPITPIFQPLSMDVVEESVRDSSALPAGATARRTAPASPPASETDPDEAAGTAGSGAQGGEPALLARTEDAPKPGGPAGPGPRVEPSPRPADTTTQAPTSTPVPQPTATPQPTAKPQPSPKPEPTPRDDSDILDPVLDPVEPVLDPIVDPVVTVVTDLLPPPTATPEPGGDEDDDDGGLLDPVLCLPLLLGLLCPD
jgi:hypothetical protein